MLASPVMARALASVALMLSATAPFQCASKSPPEERREEEPAEALYALAERFRAAGDRNAREQTLRFIVERFPASRFAIAAKVDLAEVAAAPKGAAP